MIRNLKPTFYLKPQNKINPIKTERLKIGVKKLSLPKK